MLSSPYYLSTFIVIYHLLSGQYAIGGQTGRPLLFSSLLKVYIEVLFTVILLIAALLPLNPVQLSIVTGLLSIASLSISGFTAIKCNALSLLLIAYVTCASMPCPIHSCYILSCSGCIEIVFLIFISNWQ